MSLPEGQPEEGVVQLLQGTSAWEPLGNLSLRPWIRARLAEAYGKAGHADKGLSLLAEALDWMDRRKEAWCQAEVLWMKGELLSMQGHEAEAESAFQQAIDVARRQQAKFWELRATVCLCRLWQQQGKQEHARQMLAEITGWFTQGFDTRHLQEAKTLLDELGSP